MFNAKKTIGCGLGLLGLLVLLGGCANSRVVKFEKPDIKDDFCGVVMNYRYCKCAFHNEFCDDVGLSSSAANSYVRGEYRRFVDFLQDKFKDDCISAGGIYSSGRCRYCEAPAVKDGQKCVVLEEDEEEEEEGESGFQPDGPFDQNCNIIEDEFEDSWRKYSDFDNRIDFNARSWEAQQALGAQEKLIALKVDNFKLQRDMELDRQIRLEVRDYREKLVRNQKQNLIKAFIRMSYLTYTTIKSGASAGQSFNTFLNGTEAAARVGGLLNTVKTVIPSDSRLAIDTNKVGGNVFNVGLSTALEALEKLGDPKDVAIKFMTESRNAVMPSAALSNDEIAILREHHIIKQFVDQALASSYEENAKRRKQVLANEEKIEQLEAEFQAWSGKEKARVRGMLEADCERQKQAYENNE